jgi:membrane fusion protein (multidrug efflux system)
MKRPGLFRLQFSFPNPDLTLRPGQYRRARAEIDTIPDALLIPQQAVSQLQGNDQVAVVHPDGKAEIRAVKVGQQYGRNMIVVTQGLNVGEQVIVEGFQRVRQGMAVSAKPYTDASATQGAQDDSKQNSSGQTKAATAGQKPGESGG